MKKILFLLSLIGLLQSCSLDKEDAVKFRYELVPVESVDVPASFVYGESYTITVRYARPTSCYAFDGFYYEKSENIRTIAVQNVVYQQDNCQTLNASIIEKTLLFNVLSNETYKFKFWKGKDANGQDLFLEYDIPVN